MKSEDIKKITDAALAELIQAMEQGKSECLQEYLTTMARFHRYSWGNVLLIATQKPQATRVAGYQAWLKLNRYVRKGEKGIVIIAPMVVRMKATETSEDAETRLFGFRSAYVFDGLSRDSENPSLLGGAGKLVLFLAADGRRA